MPIRTVYGNILDAQEDVIAHQVNCRGLMGAGLAKSIRKKYPDVYKSYKGLCNKYGSDMLGLAIIENISNTSPPYAIANLFGQQSAGKSKQHTDYPALWDALTSLKLHMGDAGFTTLALPYKLGCGLGGGIWEVVEFIIREVFENSEIDITIYRLLGTQLTTQAAGGLMLNIIGELVIADAENEYGQGRIITMQHSCTAEILLMDDNDMCFCGSSKIVKHCHPDTNENNLAAKLLETYAEINRRNSSADIVCNTDCAECCANCSDVHAFEFVGILDYLKIGSHLSERVRYKKIKKAIAQYIPSIGTWRMLLDQTEHMCKIYAVRPLIRRSYGATLHVENPTCENMRKRKIGGRFIGEYKFPHLEIESKISIERKPAKMPILMWFKNNADDSGKLRTKKVYDILRVSTELNLDEVVKVVKL